MYNILHKYKRFLFLLLKLAIIFGACYFIFQELVNNNLLSFVQLQDQFSKAFSKNGWAILLVLLFTDINWLLEIFKWKILASFEKNITFFEAFEQSLASLTTSIITPNRIGEYGAKAFYFKQNSRKKIVLLNLIGNLSQLLITIIFGLIGTAFFYSNFNFPNSDFNLKKILLLIVPILLLLLFRKKLMLTKISSIYFNKIFYFLKEIPPSIYIKTIALAALRYAVFTHQFYFLLKMFAVETDYFTLIYLLFLMYFITSIIPSLTIFDWAIKGSVAVWLFNFIALNELTVITVTTIMWILNFAIPAVLGSIFVLNFKFSEKE